MNEELRDAIGRAAYEAALGSDLELSWDQLTEDAKEVNMRSAEAAVKVHNDWVYEYHKRRLGFKDEDDDSAP